MTIKIPHLSIITVNLNNKLGLVKTLSSIRSQCSTNFEHIIIDGVSTDGSQEILDNYNGQNIHIVSENDSGIYNAMNKGIRLSNGSHLLFLNSGDTFFSDDTVLKLNNYIELNPEIDLLYGNLLILDNKKWIKEYPKVLTLDYFFLDTLPHPATVIKRTCFEQLSYDDSLMIVADWKFFMLGIFKKGFSYKLIPDVISCFSMDGISNLDPKMVMEERKNVLKSTFPFKFYLKYIKLKLAKAIKPIISKG